MEQNEQMNGFQNNVPGAPLRFAAASLINAHLNRFHYVRFPAL